MDRYLYARAAVLAVFLGSVLCFDASAQSGKIAGTVVDAATGEALPGVNVVVTEKWSGGEAVPASDVLGSATDADGYYAILNVPPGLYNVRASFIGFGSVVKQQVRVQSGLTATLDFQLGEEVFEGEEVQIVAEREVVRPDVSSTVEIINPERYAAAPTTRVDEFIGKLKGVQLTSGEEGNGLSIRGGAIRETDVRIDGISMRDARSENSYLSFNSATIEEIQVKTGGFEAKYGGFQSGLVNVVTKEGSRDRFTVSLQADAAPAGQKRFFGMSPWDENSPLYQVFAGPYAMDGVPDSVFEAGLVPRDPFFEGFRGWDFRRAGEPGLTAEEKQALWLARHPQYEVATRPDLFLEGAVTGPVAGKNLPLVGGYLGRTTFMAGFRYEDTQLAFPIGPRDAYTDWNAQLKLTTRFDGGAKLSVNGMIAQIETVNLGRSSQFGGALIDRANRFNFVSNTDASVVQQASLLGGNDGFTNLWNVGRTQFYDQRMYFGGAKWTKPLSDRAFYTLEAQVGYSDNLVQPFAFDTSAADAWITIGERRFLALPAQGLPGGQATPLQDQLKQFTLSGGASAADSSYSWSVDLRGDLTQQLGRHHQVEAGVSLRYDHVFAYAGINQSNQFAFAPQLFQYYTATPLEAALYVQDKLEYQGMVATVGLRAEYFNPMRHGYDVEHPLDEDFARFYDQYGDLPGDINSYERWVLFRDLLDDPEGWPRRDVGGQLHLSPRIGTSFPITTASKLYFNYGHFYQRPRFSFIYNQLVTVGEVVVPTPGLDLEKTTAVEFGYEQSLLNNYVVNATFYYKDIENRPLPRTYISYYDDLRVSTYAPDAYQDVRGIELRVEKNFGRFFTFWANYDYQIISGGQTGLARVYEDQLKADQNARAANAFRGQPRPRAYVSVTVGTPERFGPRILGFYPLGGYSINPLYEWREGGYINLTPEELNPDRQQRIDVVDYTNLDLRASKDFVVPQGTLQLTLTVTNLLDARRLATGNMTPRQRENYENSLRHPYKSGENQGDDRWGEWDRDYIDLGWYQAPLFLNPRRVILGARLQF